MMLRMLGDHGLNENVNIGKVNEAVRKGGCMVTGGSHHGYPVLICSVPCWAKVTMQGMHAGDEECIDP